MEKATRFSTREALEAISEWVAHVDPGEWESLSESELLEVMRRARKTADRVTALAGLITAAVERRNAAIQVAGVPLNTLIAQEEHRDGKDATRAVLQGRELARNPQVGKAVLDGVITAEHARGVVKAMGELPHEVTRLQAEQISSILVGQAQHSTPSQLPGKAKEALRKVAPELVPSPDDEDRLLAEQRRIALRRRSFTFGDDNEGSVWLKGSLPHLEAEPLLTTLHQLVAAGKRAERDKPRGNGVTEATREQRYADALIQLAATSGGGGARRRQPATVVVTVREEDLHANARAAGILASGQQIPAGELRKLLCEAQILPVVLGGNSEILDVGTARRFVTPAIRRTLTLRDGGCVFPGCTATDAECDAHHVLPWKHGGTTALGNLVLLCPHHHGLVEPKDDEANSRWQISFDPYTRKPVIARRRLLLRVGMLPQPGTLANTPRARAPVEHPQLC